MVEKEDDEQREKQGKGDRSQDAEVERRIAKQGNVGV